MPHGPAPDQASLSQAVGRCRLPEALKAIAEADLIILGPGSLYTSIMPNLLVEGIASRMRQAKGTKVYVCNVASQPGETDGYNLSRHVESLESHVGKGLFSYVLANDHMVAASRRSGTSTPSRLTSASLEPARPAGGYRRRHRREAADPPRPGQAGCRDHGLLLGESLDGRPDPSELDAPPRRSKKRSADAHARSILERLFGHRGSRLSTSVMVLVDVVLINAAFVVAYWLRYEVEFGGTVEEANFVPLSAFLPVQVSLTADYRPGVPCGGAVPRPAAPVLAQPAEHHRSRVTIIAVAVLIIIVFIFRPYFFSRLIFAQAWALMVVFLGLARLVEERCAACCGGGALAWCGCCSWAPATWADPSCSDWWRSPRLGYQVVGFVDDDPEKLQDIGRFKALGVTDDIPQAGTRRSRWMRSSSPCPGCRMEKSSPS